MFSAGKIKNFIFLVVFCAGLIIPASIFAQGADSGSPRLFLNGRSFDPLDGASGSVIFKSPANETSKSVNKETGSSDNSYYIVQFSGPVKAEWKQALTDIGAVIFDYIPQYAFIISADESAEGEIETLDFVRWIGEYEPELTLTNNAYDITPEELQKQDSYAKLRIIAFPDVDVDSLVDEIISRGAIVDSDSSSERSVVIDIRIPMKNIEGLKAISGIKSIEKQPSHHINNNISTGIIRLRSAQEIEWPVSGGNLYGEGQILAICDTGLDTGNTANMHLDFSDGNSGSRVVGYDVNSGASSVDYAGHGTHVAGIAVGNGMRSGSEPSNNYFPDTCFAGAAPKAELYFTAMADVNGNLAGIPANLANLFQPSYDAGARVCSNSWGSSGMGGYSSECRDVDLFMWNHKDYLVLFAAGNAGRDKDMNGIIDPYSSDTPASAKNCLSVGASESYRMGESEGYASDSWGTFRTYGEPVKSDLTSDKPYGIAAFSSRGPTIDGRFKPDVVAPGTNILSTKSSATSGQGWGAYNDYYQWMGGTSMSTPLVAGTAVIMREYLMKEEGFADPSAALVKAALLNGAESLVPGQYGESNEQEVLSMPDNSQGHGRVDFESSVNADSDFKIYYYDIDTEAPADSSYSKTFQFTVGSSQKPFKATLDWTDYPGSEVSLGGLVNDLDLRIKKPDNTWVYPNNARDLGTIVREMYVNTATGFYSADKIALSIDPSSFTSYPVTLESVGLAFSNDESIASPVSVVVYSYSNGTVGRELFRKDYAYIPTGETAVPVGIVINEGNILISVEKSNENLGIYVGADSGKGLAYESDAWTTVPITPAIMGFFRLNAPSSDFDRVNNVVSVEIPEPEVGTYTVEVSAHNIPKGPQPYALVVSALADEPSISDDVELNPSQVNSPIATLLTENCYPNDVSTVNSNYGTSLTTVYGDEAYFEVQTTVNSTISVRYAVTDLPELTPKWLKLARLFDNGTNKLFNYAEFEDYSDGNWWLTDISGRFINPVETLDRDSTYYVVSVLKDNGEYDSDRTFGTIEDPQILGLSSSSGSSGGCVIGYGHDYGTAMLIIIAVVSLLLRGIAFRRKRNL
ncbi:S8 family serine peptidase [Maridesulfovibrio bastinii]|uniref:S8 family serine peptidase n=1 Tax=Maridesulfovibrio bastinii TaxID=47157 RepID=UPI000407BF36|nr:S8 family serine peptidase [Maridesulfovibrio bastinii]